MKFLLSKLGGQILYGLLAIYLLLEIFSKDIGIKISLLSSYVIVGLLLLLVVVRETILKRKKG